ncbi:MAG: phosphatidylglycerophosphatase A [Acidobacteriota bacterium]|nr:phosphatidylglycerophosphatase A [Acidobacteriota bacterium]
MSVKESSDELNPPVVEADSVLAMQRPARSLKDYLALAIATCGVGYLPLAPGTWGSLLAVGLYLLLRFHYFNYPPHVDPEDYLVAFVGAELVVIVVVTFLGIWAASRAERVLKIKDPGKVVVDEVAGQLIALLPVSLATVGRWPILVVVAFLLFRFFDIVKPYPARKLESLHGGLGIMADDLVAGAYAAIVVAVIMWFGGLV